MKHLSDEVMQAYLDDGNNRVNAEIDLHLKTCEKCRLQYLIYKKLYNQLNKESVFSLSPGFASRIVIEIQKKAEKRLELSEEIIIGCLLMLGLGLILYFTNAGILFGHYTEIFQPSMVTFKNLFASIQPSGILNDSTIKIVSMVVITLLIIRLIDRFILQPGLHRIKSFIVF